MTFTPEQSLQKLLLTGFSSVCFGSKASISAHIAASIVLNVAIFFKKSKNALHT
jgi:hypothetical protein